MTMENDYKKTKREQLAQHVEMARGTGFRKTRIPLMDIKRKHTTKGRTNKNPLSDVESNLWS